MNRTNRLKGRFDYHPLLRLAALAVLAAALCLTESTAQTAGYSADAGKLLWKYTYTGSQASLSRPAVHDNLAIFAMETGDTIALDLQTGNEVWTTPVKNPHRGQYINPAPGLWNGKLFIPDRYDLDNGIMNCIDAATGNPLWTYTTPTGMSPNVDYRRKQILVAPEVKNGRLYFGDNQGVVYCLNPQDGSLIWRNDINVAMNRQMEGTYKYGAYEFSESCLGEKSIFLKATDGHLAGFDLATGEKKWIRKFTTWSDYDIGLLGYHDNRIYLCYRPEKANIMQDFAILALDPATGNTLWKSQRLPGNMLLDAQLSSEKIALTTKTFFVAGSADRPVTYYVKLNPSNGRSMGVRTIQRIFCGAKILDGRLYYLNHVFHLNEQPQTFSTFLNCDDEKTGRNIWKYAAQNKSTQWYQVGVIPLSDQINFSIVQGKVFVNIKKDVYCIDTGRR
ncbi:MAG: PQQ-like beta-propeller repeat protein [Spirochaetes bacterium]|nr:PQQ-like beta-propeller repeat protein [Spirochaetota bacterium]